MSGDEGHVRRVSSTRDPCLGIYRLPGDSVLLVLCPEIHDPENLGSVLRASAAFGVDGVIVGPTCPDVFSRRALRVAMAATILLYALTSGDAVPGGQGRQPAR